MGSTILIRTNFVIGRENSLKLMASTLCEIFLVMSSYPFNNFSIRRPVMNGSRMTQGRLRSGPDLRVLFFSKILSIRYLDNG